MKFSSAKSNLDIGAWKQFIVEESKFVRVPPEAELDEWLRETWEEESLGDVIDSAAKMIDNERQWM